MTSPENLILCYNKGCGTKFDPAKIDEDECCFHPGAPIFHDAYKGWSCCNKKTTDFTTFLNMKGCTKGKHNPEKPKEPQKKTPDSTTKDEIIVVNSTTKEAIRPDFYTTMSKFKVNISQSLKTALSAITDETKVKTKEEISTKVQIGQSCKNNGCRATYDGEGSNLEICKYHPGFPIFHEGMKYWYCCKKKTSDFDTFLQQEGCTTGSHCWIAKTVKTTACRYDWHQTPTDVYVTIYAKLAKPDLCLVEGNPIRLRFHIVFAENNEFDLDQELGGVISVNDSMVTMAATKVEIKMKKDDCTMWKKLFMPNKEDKTTNENEANEVDNQSDALIDSNFDPVDLSDL